MQAYKILGGALLLVALVFTSAQANCNDVEKGLVKGCVNVFVGLNKPAKNPVNTTNCRTKELKDDGCSGFFVLKTCLQVNGGCDDYAGDELKDSGMQCTYKQVSDTCGASFLRISLVTILAAAFLAMFN